MVIVEFRFYEELNDFLRPEQRKRPFCHAYAERATVKHAIEALGVPHTEVELILANGESVDFRYVLHDGDRISVYPQFEALDVMSLVRVRDRTLRKIQFIADAHLGTLARYLRFLGFDTLYRNDFRDDEIAQISLAQRRIVLTRDRDLLMRRAITHGCYVRAPLPSKQLEEVTRRLDLAGAIRPFTRCSVCNQLLEPIDKQSLHDMLAPDIVCRYKEFRVCRACHRVYWQGSHWHRLQRLIRSALGDTGTSVVGIE
jgi:uncharacterized protein with PIN domain